LGLCSQGGKLDVCGTPNQIHAINAGWMWWNIILGMDWEHAYYLHYQNRRPDYIEALM
jgi:Fe-Mn family superoxide dismutase